MTIRVSASMTETLMNLGELSIDETLVYMEAKKHGSVQAHVLAEALNGEIGAAQVVKCLDRLEKIGKVKRIESLRLGEMWKAN